MTIDTFLVPQCQDVHGEWHFMTEKARKDMPPIAAEEDPSSLVRKRIRFVRCTHAEGVIIDMQVI